MQVHIFEPIDGERAEYLGLYPEAGASLVVTKCRHFVSNGRRGVMVGVVEVPAATGAPQMRLFARYPAPGGGDPKVVIVDIMQGRHGRDIEVPIEPAPVPATVPA